MFRLLSSLGLAVVLGLTLVACGDDDGGTNNDNQAVCGDGRAEGTEACDGSDLAGTTCADLGFFAGTLSCAPNCAFNTALCEADTCGNGVAGPEEECDGADLGFNTCQSEGFAGGDLTCDNQCRLDTSSCLMVYCGSGAIEGGEVCDGEDLDGETCQTQGYDLGTLACAADCQSFDIMGCYDSTCGNDVIEGQEDCDGANLGGATCQSLGQDGGTLVCTNCHYDESGCWTQVCGDDVLQPGEVCDGTELSGQDCVSQGFDYGSLGCLGDCSDYDTSGCQNNGTGEACGDAFVILSFPASFAGADITGDYVNDHNFTGNGCDSANGAEAVFAVNLAAGETIELNETGGLNAVLRVLDTCDATADCLLSSDTPETGLRFTAPTAGTYYVVLESQNGAPSVPDYNFSVALIPPELCGDGVDNDLDGTTDCGDSDCFGDPTHCATEQLCADGLDNDAQGGTDCADTDCASAPVCGGGSQIFYEDFTSAAAWTITDGGNTTDTWFQCDTGSTPGCDESEFANATQPFMVVNSDAAGSGSTSLETLTSPVIDCSGQTSVALHFFHRYRAASGDSGVVEVFNGSSWVPVYTVTTSTAVDGEAVALDITAEAAGVATMQVRFVYTASWDWWWMVDDVEVRAN